MRFDLYSSTRRATSCLGGWRTRVFCWRIVWGDRSRSVRTERQASPRSKRGKFKIQRPARLRSDAVGSRGRRLEQIGAEGAKQASEAARTAAERARVSWRRVGPAAGGGARSARAADAARAASAQRISPSCGKARRAAAALIGGACASCPFTSGCHWGDGGEADRRPPYPRVLRRASSSGGAQRHGADSTDLLLHPRPPALPHFVR